MALGLLMWGAQAAAQGTAGPIEVVRSSSTEVVLRLTVPEPEVTPFGEAGESSVRVPGWPTTRETGAPELPSLGTLIGIPLGATLEVEVVAENRRMLPGVDPAPVPTMQILEDAETELPSQRDEFVRDLSIYRGVYPAQWVRVEPAGTLRQLPVASVQFMPFRWNPGAGAVEVAGVLEVTIRFDRGDESLERGGSMRQPGGDHPVWEQQYVSEVLNWNEARAFRRAPLTWTRSQFRAAAGGGVHEEVRLEFDQTGIYRVTFDEMVAGGWAAGPVAVQTLALEERAFDDDAPEVPFVVTQIPIHVIDTDRDGLFESGDALFFYGVDYWTRHQPHPRWKRFGRLQSYFLMSRDEGGSVMATAPSTLGRNDLVPVEDFLWTETYERSERYMTSKAEGSNPQPIDDESHSPLTGGVSNVRYDHFYWFGGQPAEGDRADVVAFDLPGFRRLERLRLPLQGITNPPSIARARPSFQIGPTTSAYTALGDTTVSNKAFVMFERGPSALRNIPLVEKGNVLRMEVPSTAYGCAVDWMEWTYRKGVEATDDVFTWASNDRSGPQEYRVRRFSGTDVVAFDVTNPDVPVHLDISGSQWSGSGASRLLTLQIDVGNGSSSRRFEARRPGAARRVLRMAPTSAVDLTEPGDDELLVITHSAFASGVGPLVAQREAQGWTVKLVDIQDVADQFNGGRKWPDAIRNYLRYLFRTRETPPGFVLLVGDASEDFIGEVENSAQNFVPTQTVFSNAYSSQDTELIASDHWFVDDLMGTGETMDFYPDMHIGRLPVGTQGELNALVSKIVNYASFSDNDQWRNRGLFMSDDAFSNRIGFDGPYLYYGSPPAGNESVFIWAAQESKRIIEAAGFNDFVADTFFLASYLDSIPCLERCDWETNGSTDCRDWTCPLENGQVTDFNTTPIPDGWPRTQQYVTNTLGLHTRLHQQMSRGHLFVSFQGHANRALATHEDIFRDQPFGARSDTDRIQNTGRPFIFLGFGCHMSEFAYVIENDSRRGDSFPELLMFLPDGRGAVAALASTAYEWLSLNAHYNRFLMQSWFESPPRDGNGGPFEYEDGQSRWLLGDLCDGGKVRMVAASPGNESYGIVATYVLLGDPSMTVDLAPPRAEQMLVNGLEYDGSHSILSEAESDSATIEVRLYDEVWLRDFTVRHGGVEVDSSLVRVEPHPEFPTDDRKAMVTYRAPLDVPVADYAIQVTGRDRAGRARTLDFPVRLTATFARQTEGEFEPLAAGAFVVGLDSLRIRMESPVRLERDDVDVYFDDEPLDARAESDSGTDRDWNWTFYAELAGEIDPGAHRLEARVRQRSGSETAARGLNVVGSAVGAVDLIHVYNFPNPFEGDTRFFYTIDGPAQGAKISIFTLRGAKIRVLEGRARAGENVVFWDGRDEDGDPVANGVYFYKLQVDRFEGGSISRVERVARIR